MKLFKIRVNGNEYEVEVEEITKKPGASPSQPVQLETHTPKPVVKETSKPTPQVQEGEQTILAPMPGTILDVKVSAGETINKGQTLMILEAMKMENEILAPHDCTVVQTYVTKGASVNAGDTLIVLS